MTGREKARQSWQDGKGVGYISHQSRLIVRSHIREIIAAFYSTLQPQIQQLAITDFYNIRQFLRAGTYSYEKKRSYGIIE